MADGLNDLKTHVMRVFEDATKDSVDMELKEQFDIMIGDSGSLNQYALGMFDSMVRHDMVDQGRELFRPVTMPGTLPDVAVYTIVILVYAHAGKIRDALKVYHHMLSTAVAPTAYTYTVLITAIGRDSSGADFVGYAKKFFLEMLDRGMKPLSETYMVVLDLVAYREPAEKVKEFLEQIEAKAWLSPGSKAYQLKEGHLTYTKHLPRWCCERGEN